MIRFFYSYFLYPLIHAAAFLLSFFNSKVALGFALRKNKSWLKADLSSVNSNATCKLPLIWFHVASGEFEYAKPVIRELKSMYKAQSKTCLILVTYFSPSVLNSLKKCPDVDIAVPMPWDTPWDWSQFLNHYQPKVLAIARTDTWPNLVWQAKRHKIPSLLFSATLPSESGRVASFWGRLLYGRIIEEIDHISCVTEEDQDNFLRLNNQASLSIDGDTRFDQVLFRLSNSPYVTQSSLKGARVFVAGSTWPQDEKILAEALRSPLKKGLIAFVAPHEPTSSHLKSLKELFQNSGISQIKLWNEIAKPREVIGSREIASSQDWPDLFSSLKPGDVILVGQVGILADLYKLASVSFVGGSFKKSVHSVMEPAAAGNLVCVGPYYSNSREAIALIKSKLAINIENSEKLKSILLAELKLSALQIEAREAQILEFVKSRSGVSRKIAHWIFERANS